MDTSSDNVDINLITLNWKTSYESGSLNLPMDFNIKFGEKLSDKVHVKEPGGTIWIGKYEKSIGRIKGLQNLFSFYGMTKYNLTMLQYVGGSNFKLHIFNSYAVEIEYPFGYVVNQSGREISEVENDKIGMQFKFNGYNRHSKMYEMKIKKKHLELKLYKEIFQKEALRKLNIDQSLGSIKIGFVTKKWLINFKSEDGHMYLADGWNEFVRDARLCEGDICIIQSTGVVNLFEAAVFHMKDISKWIMHQGEFHNKCKARFFKIMDERSMESGDFCLPKVFMQKYGKKLSNDVTLWMGDSIVWIASFCKEKESVKGLHRLLKNYSVMANYILVLHYLGCSTFHMTIFSKNGMDILEELTTKVSLKDVVVTETGGSSYANEDEDAASDQYSDEEESDTTDSSLVEMVEDDESEDTTDVENSSEEEISTNMLSNFFVTLSSSHFDGKCHGAYCPATLQVPHRQIQKGMQVILVYGDKQWEIKANPVGKAFRLGQGWSDFLVDNRFVVGQRLKFEYCSAPGILFNVSRSF